MLSHLKNLRKNSYPWLHHDLDGDHSGLVEVSEDVGVGKEDGGVELEQEPAQDNAGEGSKTEDDKTKNTGRREHHQSSDFSVGKEKFGRAWGRPAVKLNVIEIESGLKAILATH